MELKKIKKADLENKKTLFFEIGLAVALIVMLVAFTWKSEAKKESIFDIGPQVVIEEENVPITQEEPPKPQEIPKVNIAPEEIMIASNDIQLDMDMSLFNSDDNKLGIQTMEYVEKKEVVVTQEKEEEEVIPFAIVETKPSFQGGDANKFPAWVQKQVKYPEAASENGIQGTVYLQFTIATDGSITNIKIMRSVDPLLDEEAIRALKLSPKWTPGMQRSKAVPVSYQFPVRFRLDNQ
ncbi:MAG: TonB family protein [Prevotellaceae bacterium]|nr:TonB family protein [Prevotellaceae bacterium]